MLRTVEVIVAGPGGLLRGLGPAAAAAAPTFKWRSSERLSDVSAHLHVAPHRVAVQVVGDSPNYNIRLERP